MRDKLKPKNLFILVENVLYGVIAVILIIGALFIIYEEIKTFLRYPTLEDQEHIQWLIEMIGTTLLLIMVIEILYTVRVSFEEHILTPEPFLIVAMIAAVRRILIISVEIAYLPDQFEHLIIELGVLGGLILIFVISLILFRRQKEAAT
ncbi:MAG: hypothetical protein GF372_10095 [Candidatus Marinimicrobia bacterium]|nr:hypothetical protein [Candidatus Neomarinimicrobiota bacterium]